MAKNIPFVESIIKILPGTRSLDGIKVAAILFFK